MSDIISKALVGVMYLACFLIIQFTVTGIQVQYMSYLGLIFDFVPIGQWPVKAHPIRITGRTRRLILQLHELSLYEPYSMVNRVWACKMEGALGSFIHDVVGRDKAVEPYPWCER